jgi:hypothetical protein
MIDFEKDAHALGVKEDGLKGLSDLARRAKVLEHEMDQLEATLKERKESYRKITEEALPEAMAELGMKSFVMDDGSKIDVKPFYSATISAERRAEAYEWLRQRGFDDIIKNTVSVRFGRGEDELCTRLLDLLRTQGYPSEQVEKIEPMTLKAWVKEQIERGSELPTELFGVYIGQKATIKT